MRREEILLFGRQGGQPGSRLPLVQGDLVELNSAHDFHGTLGRQAAVFRFKAHAQYAIQHQRQKAD